MPVATLRALGRLGLLDDRTSPHLAHGGQRLPPAEVLRAITRARLAAREAAARGGGEGTAAARQADANLATVVAALKARVN